MLTVCVLLHLITDLLFSDTNHTWEEKKSPLLLVIKETFKEEKLCVQQRLRLIRKTFDKAHVTLF